VTNREIRTRALADYRGGRSDGFDEYDGYGCYERTNLDRALNGRDMIALALTSSHYAAFEDYETGLVDALANLLHFARRYEIDFEEALADARDHHNTEKLSGWDEIPDEKLPAQ
jgi:hypothetical protein